MSEYNGPERREDAVHLCHIGVKRFDKVEEKVDEMHPIVTNGLSQLPGTMKWGFGIMITILLVLAGLMGSTRVEAAKVGQRLDDHEQLQSHGIVDDRLDDLEHEVRLLREAE